MQMNITIEFQNERLLKAFSKVQKRCRNMKLAWEIIGNDLVNSVQKTFDVEGRPQKWPPLKVKTLLRKVGGKRKAYKKSGSLTARAKRILGGNKILTDSSRLRNSITYQAANDSVIVGSNVVYAATHQFGRTQGRGAPIPVRPFLTIHEEDELLMAQTLETYFTEEL